MFSYFLICFVFVCTSRGQDLSESTTDKIQVCNQTFHEKNGVISSPNYPSKYPSNTFCQWQIVVDESSTLYLRFRHFNIESSRGCSYDSLSIYNGPTTSHPMLGKFCGPFRPGDVTATSNRMLLRMKTDDATEKEGFVAFYFSVTPGIAKPNSCGGLMTRDEGSFHSVNFPDQPYPNDVTCTWHIRTDPGRKIILEFPKLQIEQTTNCAYDSLTVVSGWTNSDETRFHGRYCHISQIPDVLRSAGNEMYVIFSTDSSGNAEGFYAQYVVEGQAPTTPGSTVPSKKAYDEASSDLPTECRETQVIAEGRGVILSPGFKIVNEYQSNLRCSWLIVTPRDTRVKLRLTSFELEEDPECLFDYVAVYNGRSRNGQQIARYCGSLDDSRVTSLENEMFIEFVTDSGRGAAGFRAEFSSQDTRTTIPATTTTKSTTTPTQTAVTSSTGIPTTACPASCLDLDLAQVPVCTVSHVLLFKVVKIQGDNAREQKRILVSVQRIYKNTGLVAAKRRGSKLWFDVPCTSCFPGFRKRGKYILIGTSSGKPVISPTDFLEVSKKKLVRFIKKSVRRCRRPRKKNRVSKKKKRNSKGRKGRKGKKSRQVKA